MFLDNSEKIHFLKVYILGLIKPFFKFVQLFIRRETVKPILTHILYKSTQPFILKGSSVFSQAKLWVDFQNDYYLVSIFRLNYTVGVSLVEIMVQTLELTADKSTFSPQNEYSQRIQNQYFVLRYDNTFSILQLYKKKPKSYPLSNYLNKYIDVTQQSWVQILCWY